MLSYADPAELSPNERAARVAGILTRGVLRLATRAAVGPHVADPGQEVSDSSQNPPHHALISPPDRASMDPPVSAHERARGGG